MPLSASSLRSVAPGSRCVSLGALGAGPICFAARVWSRLFWAHTKNCVRNKENEQ